MVLCVSNIVTWAPAADDEEWTSDPHPELEVTDGWYRLRARIDLPLARAVRRGLIKGGYIAHKPLYLGESLGGKWQAA